MSQHRDGGPASVTGETENPARANRSESAFEERLNPFTDPAQTVPTLLRTDEFFLRPIVVADAARDYEAVMETRADLRVWEQSSWPADDFTVEANAEDLADLERRHLERRAFTYAVLNPEGGTSLGCVYLFPTTATFLSRASVKPVTEDAVWGAVDAVLYFWVRKSRVASGMDIRLLSALRSWMSDEWAFARTVFVTNDQFVQQVQLLDSVDLQVLFELREPGKPGAYLVYG